MPIRDAIIYFCERYNVSKAQATSTVYALLESGFLYEETYALRFMDTQVHPTVTQYELDTIVQQLFEGESNVELPPIVDSSTPEKQDFYLVASTPLGLATSFLDSVSSMRSAFSEIICSAQKTLRISSPYIEQPGLNLLLQAFEVAAKNKVQLRLLIRIDDRFQPDMRQLMAILTLHELFGETMDVRSLSKVVRNNQRSLSMGGVHAKVLVADDAQAYIGSGEIRDHSLNRNFELGVVVSNPNTVVSVVSLFDAVWNMASEVSPTYCRSFVK